MLETYEVEVGRLNSSGEPHPERIKALTAPQERAYNDILMQFMKKRVTLLHGVTSSGKTEIYIHLIQREIDKHRQVLYLLPEIALTVQIMQRLKNVFGNRLGIYHSKYSDAERVEIWKKQLSAHPYDVILGARSAVFLPFQHLGLVIVDEEHETSFKQQDPAPRYHARSAAIMLPQAPKVLLGTATPSMETFHNAQLGKFGYVALTERHAGIEPRPERDKYQTLIMNLPRFLTEEVDEDTSEFEKFEEPESTRKVTPVSPEQKETGSVSETAGIAVAGAAVAASQILSGPEQQSLFADETDLVSELKKKEKATNPETGADAKPVVIDAGMQARTEASVPEFNSDPESVNEAEITPVVIPVAAQPAVSEPVLVSEDDRVTGENPVTAANAAAVDNPATAASGQITGAKAAEPERHYVKPKKKTGFLGKMLAVIVLLFLLVAGGVFYFFSSSKPDIVVADVNGKPVAEARKALESQGFKVEIENKVDPSIKPGMVLRMDPVAGIKRKEGATITLVVSGTEKMITVPKVVGLKQDQAERLLSDKSLRIEKIEYKWDEKKPEGIILGQSPEENSQLGDNGAVNIIINKKEEKNVALPDLKGVTLAEARKKLEELKLKVEVREEDSDKNKDTVIGMSPNANDTITEGSTVILQVSNAKLKMPFPATPEGISNNSGKSNGSVTVSKTTGARYAEFVVPGTGTHTVQIVSNNGRTQKVEVSGSYNGGVRLRTRVDSDVQRVGFYVDHRLVEEKSW